MAVSGRRSGPQASPAYDNKFKHGFMRIGMGRRYKVVKPFAYYDLIAEAIRASPSELATVGMIFSYATRRYPSIFTESNSHVWKSNIRQLLSRHPEFSKHGEMRTGRQHFWYRSSRRAEQLRRQKKCAEQLRHLYRCLNMPMPANKADRADRKADRLHSSRAYASRAPVSGRASSTENASGIASTEKARGMDDLLGGCMPGTQTEDIKRKHSMRAIDSVKDGGYSSYEACGLCMKSITAGCCCLLAVDALCDDYTPVAHGLYNEDGYWFQSHITEDDTGEETADKLWFRATRHTHGV